MISKFSGYVENPVRLRYIRTYRWFLINFKPATDNQTACRGITGYCETLSAICTNLSMVIIVAVFYLYNFWTTFEWRRLNKELHFIRIMLLPSTLRQRVGSSNPGTIPNFSVDAFMETKHQLLSGARKISRIKTACPRERVTTDSSIIRSRFFRPSWPWTGQLTTKGSSLVTR